MNHQSGRREGLPKALGRSLNSRGGTADHAGIGNRGAHWARWWTLAVMAALLISLAVLATAPPEQAAAQTVTTFISNTGQTSTTTDSDIRATAFTTGAATYTLSSVGIYLGSVPASTITPVVRIHENDATTSFIGPGDVVATLTNPATFQAGAVNSFTAPTGTTLRTGRTYWVVTTNSATTNRTGFQVGTINSTSVDSGTATGWNLGVSRFKTAITQSAWTSSSGRIRFAVRGAVANYAPTASGGSVITNEGTDYTFAAADFNFADTDTGDTLSSVKIVTLPGTGKGTLELDGTAIASTALPQTVTKADIDASKLKYSPPADGPTFATFFRFKVNDGTQDSAFASTMTIDVKAVNDPATGTPTITGTAQVGETLTASTTGIMDADGLTGVTYTYQWVRVIGTTDAHIPGATSSTYTLVTADQGKTIKVKVSFTDNGGTAETRTSAATAAVAAVTNAAPTASNSTVTMNENTSYTFTAADFNFADTDTGDALSSVKIVTLPGSGKGTLSLDGTAIASTALPQTVTKADIDASKLKYSPPANANGSAYASFTFKVNDGTDDSATANTMTIDVTAVNDPATGRPTITGTAQVRQTLTADTSGIMDADGLTNVSYTYQWIRVDAGTETDISGADWSSYTLVNADVGRTIKVRVSFTDDAGNPETLTSTATPTAQQRERAETTLVSNIGQSHDAWGRIQTTSSQSLKAAQPFTTGANPLGYQLSTVKVMARSQSFAQSPDAVFTINAISGDAVEEVLYTLTTPTGFSSLPTRAQEYSLSAPSNAILEPSTTYALVFAVNSGGFQSSITNSDDVDTGALPGWGIRSASVTSNSNSNAGAWGTRASSVRIALLGEVLTASASELPGEDFPGRHSRMRTTNGLVDPRDVATGELTALHDDVPAGSRSPAGLRGDYFRLKVQPGHEYRLQAFFKETAEGSVPLSTGGSIGLAFYNIASGQRAGLSPGSDHNRDDGVTIVHFGATGGREYYVKVNVYDQYNGDKSTKYHGKYHLVLTDITGVTLLTNNMIFDVGDDATVRDETVGTTSWGMFFSTGTHSAGYKIDRLQLFIEDTNTNATPVVTIRAMSGEFPGDTVCTFVGLDGYASGLTLDGDVPDTLYPDPDNCQDLDPGTSQNYWLVMEAQDTTKGYKVGALVVTYTVRGPAAGWTVAGSMAEKDSSDTTPVWSLVGLDQHILFRLWGTPKTSSASSATAADPPTVTGAPAVSEAGPDGEWTPGETVGVTLTFSEAVTVDTTGGTPTVGISLGGTQARSAAYVSGSGTTNLLFGYTLTDADGSHSSMIVTHNSLALNGGTIQSQATSVDAELAHNGAAVQASPAPKNAPKGSDEETANSPATGAPSISGTAQVNETLTADTSGISDTDGMAKATFAYQWVAGTADITGATGSSHTLTSGDQGRSIKVKVRFTDDAGNSEELISAATFAVALPPLKATIHDASDSHDGQTAFTFKLRLSEEFSVSYKTLRDHAFTETGGEVIKARWLNPPSSVGWEITVQPDGDDTVTIVLPVTTDCASDGAVCTPDGRMLSNSSTITVPGPATQSQPAQVENSPATGLPTITGTATVGNTLGVSMSAVSDENGMTNASYSHQWLADDVNIQGATGATYTLAAGDEGKAIKVKVSFTDDDGFAESVTSTATAAVAAKPNTPATGLPAISGTVQVGKTLTVSTSAIADEDGLSGVSYAYQWIAGTADIAEATGSSYTLTSGDQGRSIKVKVRFTDDAGNSEELISAATFAVAPPPLTATIHDAADSHDGQTAFTFELRFSEEFYISYKTLQDHAFTVTGGEVIKASRLNPPSNVGWEITVQASGNEIVTIVLPITTDCTATGAVCTPDGRMLSNRLEFTVSGPGE